MPGPPDAQQRPGFMDLHVAHGTVLVGLQVAHDAGFADLGGGVEKESRVRAPLVIQHQLPAPQRLLLTFKSPLLSILSLLLSPFRGSAWSCFAQTATAPSPSPGGACACLCQAGVLHPAESEPRV